jgi:hypothetical protein
MRLQYPKSKKKHNIMLLTLFLLKIQAKLKVSLSCENEPEAYPIWNDLDPYPISSDPEI